MEATVAPKKENIVKQIITITKKFVEYIIKINL